MEELNAYQIYQKIIAQIGFLMTIGANADSEVKAMCHEEAEDLAIHASIMRHEWLQSV